MGGWAGLGTHCHLLAVKFFQPTKTTSQSLDGLFDLCERTAVGFLALEQAGTVFWGGEISPEFSRGPSRELSGWDGISFVKLGIRKHQGKVRRRYLRKASFRSWEGMIWCSWLLLR